MDATLPWTLAFLATAVAAALGWLAYRRRPKAELPLPNEWSLTPRPVFNEQERRVHRQLREALPQHVVLAKLPLVRFCQPTDPAQVRFWFDLLGAIHVSFAVCSANGRVLAAVDLDDTRPPARRSTLVKQAVLAACHIRYVRYSPEQTPSVPELQLLVPATPAVPAPAPPSAVVRAGFSPAAMKVDAFRQRAQPVRWPPNGEHRDSSSFGRDSVISGFSQSLPNIMPDREGEVVDAPQARH